MIELINLDYALDALEPAIDAMTVDIHHNKHHQAYVNNVNGLLEGTTLEGKSLIEVLKNIDDAPSEKKKGINNNAGGVFMHNVYFKQFSESPSEISGDLKNNVEQIFGSYDTMIEQLKQKAMTQFGSGWSALVVDNSSKNLEIIQVANQDIAEVIKNNKTPIVVLDVWEHAYYLKYQNKRAEYLDEIVKIIDWNKVQENYTNI